VKIGLDLGSAAIKTVFVDGEDLVWRGLAPTAPGQEALAARLIAEGRRVLGLSADAALAATGYGRHLFPAADLVVDERSAGALGIFRRSGGAARSVLNIGGQDLKSLKLSAAGQVLDFRMNDKCAAGTGRFFELAARILDTPLEDFGPLGTQAREDVELNSTCVVFAESEMVSLLARGVARESVIRALNVSVARRAAGLLGREGATGLWLDGGPALNEGLREALEEELLTEVRVPPEPQYTVAYGAALSLGA
jgi:predicted CoA-substrate-specific enzyme activase